MHYQTSAAVEITGKKGSMKSGMKQKLKGHSLIYVECVYTIFVGVEKMNENLRMIIIKHEEFHSKISIKFCKQ